MEWLFFYYHVILSLLSMKISKKKLLIISCSGGMGHIRAAEALQAHCKKFYPEITCQHFNAAEYSGWFLNASLVKSYEFLIKKHPKVFGALFKLADTAVGKKYIELHTPLLRRSGEPLIDAIARFKPDRIIVTHPIVMPLLEKLPSAPPIDVVVTDYYANKMWLHPDIRHLFVATSEMKEELANEHSSVIVSGIPLQPVFFEDKDINKLKKLWKIKPNLPTLLLLSGGEGLVDISTTTKHLLKENSNLNIITIAGKNAALYTKLTSLSPHTNNYQALTFTQKIDELMRIADIIITKPGGLTVAECLYLKKPLITINPIPGQEEANESYITTHKFGIAATTNTEVLQAVRELLAGNIALSLVPDLPNPNSKIIESGIS